MTDPDPALRIRDQWPWMKTAAVWFFLIAALFAALFWVRVLTRPDYDALTQTVTVKVHGVE